jgi:hypothetical protein
MTDQHLLLPTEDQRRAAIEARYFAAARLAGVTRRVAAKALDAAKAAGAESPVDAAWGALGARARGRA